jgi:hypothetical protein
MLEKEAGWRGKCVELGGDVKGSLKDTSICGVSTFVDSYRHVTVRL